MRALFMPNLANPNLTPFNYRLSIQRVHWQPDMTFYTCAMRSNHIDIGA